MTCTEEEESIDSMIKAFRARHKATLNELMEVDSMNLDRFAYGRKDPQDVLVPVAEEMPYKYMSRTEVEIRKRMGLLKEDEDDE